MDPYRYHNGSSVLIDQFHRKKRTKKEEKITEEATEPSIPIHQRTVSRDRIINPKKPKEE
ncbi:hypothetical protein [Chryseobacterium sp. CH25]|uniref:hypothetical protein n=1 Tax=Chryseobacterium sp. CH25 TaxID=713559 RepID=UPI001E47AF6F|nr:hypothetical protein [Chryseobacterium sp. CH25]